MSDYLRRRTPRCRFGLRPAACAVSALVASGALLAACGDPSAVPRKFEYEPAPVITLANGTPVIMVTEGCGSLLPDRVRVSVSNESLRAVEEWINEVGFEVLERTATKRGFVLLHIRVPFGASPDARDALAEREGVIAADVAGTAEGPNPCTTH